MGERAIIRQADNFAGEEGSEILSEQQQDLVRWVNSTLADCERPEPAIKYVTEEEEDRREEDSV